MEKITVNGGRPLFGHVAVSGSKNAALPILFATLTARGVSKIVRVPDISDTRVALEIISGLGATVLREGDTVFVDARRLCYNKPNPALVSKIRASTYLLGAMLAAFGKCPLMDFGGCNFASRPIDLHIYAFQCLGATIKDDALMLDKPRPAEICFKKASVGATANALILASSIDGTSIIRGHAVEPHIMALVSFLRSMGAEITMSEDSITVKGTELHGGSTEIVGDMIEAGSYLALGLVTGGQVTVSGCPREQMRAFCDFLSTLDVCVSEESDKISCLWGSQRKYSTLCAEPYPAYPTDLQPIAAPILAKGDGGIIYDKVFPDRFGYLRELSKFGLKSRTFSGYAEILPSRLYAADSIAPDLRGGMACLICALGASGESHVYSPEMLLRGYENLEIKLRRLGADIKFE